MASILTLKRILLTIAAAASLTVAGTAMATAGNSGSTLPGWGFGDKNHVHTGPPGNSGCQDEHGKHCCNTVGGNSVKCCNNNSASKKCCDQNTVSNSANKCKDHDGDNDGDNDVDGNTVHDNTVHTNAVH